MGVIDRMSRDLKAGVRLSPGWIAALCYAMIVLGPGIALCANLVSISPADLGDVRLELLVPAGRRLVLWWRSAGLAAAVALGDMVLGSLAALWFSRWPTGARGSLRWLVLVLSPLPALTHAMAWSWLFGRLNAALQQQGLGGIPFRGWAAAWWVQMLWLAPIAIGLALVAFESIDASLIEAGRMHHPGKRVLSRIVLPLAAPMLLAGSGVIFVLSLVDYAVPSLFQVNVYALEIFADFSAHNQPGRALLISGPLLATTVAVTLYSQARLRPAALSPSRRRVGLAMGDWRRNWSEPDASARWLLALQQGAVGVIAIGLAVPLVSLLAQLDSWSRLMATLSSARSEIGYSLGVALLTALLSLPLAHVAASGVVQQRGPWFWWLAITVPLAVPGPLVGIGLIGIWNSPFVQPLRIYGSPVMPVLASLARYTPLGALVLVATLRRINPALIEAAWVLQPRRLRSYLWVHLPLRAAGLLAAFGLVFCLTLGELSATLLVAAPGHGTLSLRIYNYLHYGASDTVAGLILAMTGLVLAMGLIIAASLSVWARLSSGAYAGKGDHA